ncbi:cysteine protease ATG4D isoform X5 [Corvus hawaiiensis]|uniref:cysteine protease ATG4D isoform X5 n=1 Tax=Corvus hawaiiensis TaxID=134902 RepID=UPI002018CDA9|nr:cysteine protease ATG4D isoform X5 [Corvus hawaiiensis]
MSGGGEGPGPPPGPAPGSAPGPAPGPPPGAERGGQRVRGRVLAAWNSVKYGWTLRPRPHFSPRDPLYLLGRVYAPGNGEELARFRRDFCSRLWFTYRSGFPALPGTPRTTDCGWGCTLRSAQMLLGQGLVLHLLGRDWTWPEALLELEPGGTRRSRDPPGRTRDGPRVPWDGHGSPRPDTGSPGWTRDPPGMYPGPPRTDATPPEWTGTAWGGYGTPQDGHGVPRGDTGPLGTGTGPPGEAPGPPWTDTAPPGIPPSPPRRGAAAPRHRILVLRPPPRPVRDPPARGAGPGVREERRGLVRPRHRRAPAAGGRGILHGDPRARRLRGPGLHRLVRGDPEGGTAGPGAPGHGTPGAPGASGHGTPGSGTPGQGTPGAPGASGHGTPGSGTPGAPGQRRGLVLLVPARLGGESLNPVYVECVKELLQLRSCLGIIGGKPRHSLFFLGFQGDSLLYLDPHLCQASVDTAREKFPLQSFHCCFPRKMPFGKMDPSCTFGFYAGGTELEQLWGDLARVLAPPSAPERYPIFTLAEGHAQDQALDTPPGPPPSLPRQGKRPKKPNSDEFVFL